MMSFDSFSYPLLLKLKDPFVILTIGTQKKTTSVAKDAGKTPSWNDVFDFKILNEELMTF